MASKSVTRSGGRSVSDTNRRPEGDTQLKSKQIIRTPFNKFIRLKDAEPNILNRKAKLAEINIAIYERGLSDDLEMILNIMHLKEVLLFKLDDRLLDPSSPGDENK